MKRQVPVFSLISLVPALLFGFGSYPIWLRAFDDPTGKAGMFILIAAITCATLTAGGGALVGIILSIVAHVRRERFIAIRALSFFGNLALTGYALYVWFSLPRA